MKKTKNEIYDGCLKPIAFLLLGFLLAGCLTCGIFIIPKWYTQYQISNSISGMFKKEPTIRFVNSYEWYEMLEIQFNVICPEDYKEVTVEVTICDEHDVILTQEYLTGTNYKKDNVYRLSYELTLEQILNADHIEYKIHKYK